METTHREDLEDTQPHQVADTKPHRRYPDDTPPHGLPPDDTKPKQKAVALPGPFVPSLDDLQPGRPVNRSGLALVRLGTPIFRIGLVTLGVLMMLFAMYRLVPPPRMTVLLMGIDGRPQEGWKARSDSMMLVTVNPTQMKVGMLSIPRDLYVPIPGYADNRINTAHVLGEVGEAGGGPVLAARTVQLNFGVPVQRTLRVKFDGFVRIIDAAGGVNINVPNRIVDMKYPTNDLQTTTVTFEPGFQHMDGQRALIYVRTRHGDSDFSRAKRQQDMISALLYKLISPNGWQYWPGTLLAITQNVDTNLTLFDVFMYAPAILWVGPTGIERHDLGNGLATSYQTSTGAQVLAPNWDLINPMVDEMFGE